MENKHIITLDYIRVVALAGVVFDHWLQRFTNTVLYYSGLWMGGVCVTIFFSLSAYLFGKRWRQQKYASFSPVSFLKKRCLRIYAPLWLVLLLIIPMEFYWAHSFDIKTVFFNFIGLGWVKPFSVGGHLWYITMMMILYVAFIFFSFFRLDKMSLGLWLFVLAAIVFLYAAFPNLFMTYSHAGPPLFLWMAGLLFYKGGEIEALITKHSFLAILTVIVLSVTSWLLYIKVPGWHDDFKQWATLTTGLVGFIIFVVLMTIISTTRKEFVLINHIASLSYEYYLVHLPLLVIVTSIIPYNWLSLPLWLIVSWMFAYALQYITNVLIRNKLLSELIKR